MYFQKVYLDSHKRNVIIVIQFNFNQAFREKSNDQDCLREPMGGVNRHMNGDETSLSSFYVDTLS